jgi:hypothetical protein
VHRGFVRIQIAVSVDRRPHGESMNAIGKTPFEGVPK